MKNNRLVSIIIPTYNVEKYLLQCLESINSQTYNNYECIIIIDGSKDNSYEVAKQYCLSHQKFSVFWQENAGSGPARNNGIDHASGDFVMFVDPDDWIKPELLENLMLAQTEGNYDITTSRKQSYLDINGVISEKPLSGYIGFLMNNQKEMKDNHKKVIEAGYCSAPTRTLYKMSIIREKSIKFPPLRRSQDVAFNCLYYRYAQSFKSIEYVGYCYRVIPKTGFAKDRSKYHETFIVLYNMFNEMYDYWGAPFDKCFFASLLFKRYFYGSLRLCVQQGVDILPILKNESVRSIIKEINFSLNTVGITVALIKSKCYYLTILFLLMVNKIKS